MPDSNASSLDFDHARGLVQPQTTTNPEHFLAFQALAHTHPQSQKANQRQRHGWMQPDAEIPSSNAHVTDTAHLSVCQADIQLAFPDVRPIPNNHDPDTSWAVDHAFHGVTLAIATGPAACRSHTIVTLLPDLARTIATLLLTEVDLFRKGVTSSTSTRFGDAYDMSGYVGRVTYGIGLSITTYPADYGYSSMFALTFRGADTARDMATLLLAHADALDLARTGSVGGAS